MLENLYRPIFQKCLELRDGDLYMDYQLTDSHYSLLPDDDQVYTTFLKVLAETMMVQESLNDGTPALNGGQKKKKIKENTIKLQAMGDELKNIIKTIKKELDTNHITPPSPHVPALPPHDDLGLDDSDEDIKDDHDDIDDNDDDFEKEDIPPKKNSKVKKLVTEKNLKKEKKTKIKKRKKSRTLSDDVDMEDTPSSKITREEFEAEKALFLEQVPDSVKQLYREVGFAEWKSDWLPVIIVGPYDVSGPLRNDYKVMFEKTRKNGRNPTHLVYWYGTLEDKFNEGFSLTGKFVSYEEGVKKHYLTKKPKNKKIAELQERGLGELDKERQLPKEERIKSIPGFKLLKEEYETDSDIDNEDDDSDESEDFEEEEKPVKRKMKKSQSSTKPNKKSLKNELDKEKKRLKKKSHQDNESDSENKDFKPAIEEEKPASKKKKTSKSNTKPKETSSTKQREKRSLDDGDSGPVKKRKKKNSSNSVPEDFDGDKIKLIPEASNDDLNEEYPSEDDLNDDDYSMKSLSESDKDDEDYEDTKHKKIRKVKSPKKVKINSEEVKRKKSEKTPKKKDKSTKKERKSKGTGKIDEKELESIVEKLLNASDVAVAGENLTKLKENINAISFQWFAENKIGKKIRKKMKGFPALTDAYEDFKVEISKKLSPKVEVQNIEIKKNQKPLETKGLEKSTEEAPLSKIELATTSNIEPNPPSRPSVGFQMNDSDGLKENKKEKPKQPRKSFSLANIIQTKPSTPATKKVEDETEQTQMKVEQTLPSWITDEYDESKHLNDDRREFALDFFMEASKCLPEANCLPEGRVNRTSIARHLEEALNNKYPDDVRKYWETVHDVCGGICGKRHLGSLGLKIVAGEYNDPATIVDIPRKILFRSFNGYSI